MGGGAECVCVWGRGGPVEHLDFHRDAADAAYVRYVTIPYLAYN